MSLDDCLFVSRVLASGNIMQPTYSKEIIAARRVISERYEALKGNGLSFMESADQARAEWLKSYLEAKP
jgi:hypothetical protein